MADSTDSQKEPEPESTVTNDTKVENKPVKGKSFAEKITDTVTTSGSLAPTSESEKISANARVVILGLFALVGFLVLLFAITLTRTSLALSAEMVQVFSIAITGAFTLGGVLITQLWGK